MSLSKLAGTVAQAAQQITAKGGKKLASVTSGSKIIEKTTAGSLEALAAQGKAIVRKAGKKSDLSSLSPRAKEKFVRNAKKTWEPYFNPKQFDAIHMTPAVKSIVPGEYKAIWNGGDFDIVKSAEDSAKFIAAQKGLNEALETSLANKSAEDSARVIINSGKITKRSSLKPEVIQRKAELAEKYGDKLSQFKVQKAQAQRKADLLAKYGDRLNK